MIACCSLWPLQLEVSLQEDTEVFVTLLLQLRKSLWPLKPCHQGQNQISEDRCFSSVAILVPALASLSLLSNPTGQQLWGTVWGWREWGLGKNLKGLMQGRRNFPNPQNLGPLVQCCSFRVMLGENLIKSKSELEVPLSSTSIHMPWKPFILPPSAPSLVPPLLTLPDLICSGPLVGTKCPAYPRLKTALALVVGPHSSFSV